jgi:hypothetical protein
MNQIPPLAWAAIAVIVLLTVAINVSMFTMLHAHRKGVPSPSKRAKQRPGVTNNLRTMSDVLRDPFAAERAQLDELSSLLHQTEPDASQNDKPKSEEEP